MLKLCCVTGFRGLHLHVPRLSLSSSLRHDADMEAPATWDKTCVSLLPLWVKSRGQENAEVGCNATTVDFRSAAAANGLHSIKTDKMEEIFMCWHRQVNELEIEGAVKPIRMHPWISSVTTLERVLHEARIFSRSTMMQFWEQGCTKEGTLRVPAYPFVLSVEMDEIKHPEGVCSRRVTVVQSNLCSLQDVS